MKISKDYAIELGNAFLDAAEMANESDTPAVIIELNEQTVLAVSDPEDGFDSGLPAICVVT
jgi:hypothetical protein